MEKDGHRYAGDLRGSGLQAVTLQVGLLICLFVSLALVLLIISGSADNSVFDISAVPLPVYSFLLFGLSFGFLCILLYKTKTYIPSLFLFVFFLAVPIVGRVSYEMFVELHGNFFGKQLSFEYPVFVWSVGTAVFFAGVLLAHLLPSAPKNRLKVIWNAPRLQVFLWLCLGAAMIAALVVVAKIGYVPILHAGIDEIRRNFENVVGRYTAKFSRLFVVASFISAILFFLSKRKKLFLLLCVFSMLGTTLYGERMYAFYGIIFFLLIYLKFHKPTKRQLLLFAGVGCCLLAVFMLVAENRANRLDKGITLKESVVLPLFTEYSYYAFMIDEISGTKQYLQEDIFWGAIALLFPRQIWAVFGIDKDYLIQKYSAIDHFGKIFNDPNGTRITPIGEAYAGYGIFWGVCLQLSLFGFIFGLLEKVYLRLHKLDARLCLVCFLIVVLMWMPITTLSAIIEPALFFGWILLALYVLGANRVAAKR